MGKENQINEFQDIFKTFFYDALSVTYFQCYRVEENTLIVFLKDFIIYLEEQRNRNNNSMSFEFLQELIRLIKIDIVFQKYYKNKSLWRVNLIKEYVSVPEKKNKIDNLLKDLKILYKHLEHNSSYKRNLIAELKEYLIQWNHNTEFKNKNKFIQLSNTFKNILLHDQKLSKKYLDYNRVKYLEDNSKVNIYTWINKILGLILIEEKPFEVHFKIKIPENQPNKNKLEWEDLCWIFNDFSKMQDKSIDLNAKMYHWININHIEDNYSTIFEWFSKANSNEFYVSIKLSWIDYLKIIHKARTILTSYLEILHFEFNTLSIKISNISIATTDFYSKEEDKEEKMCFFHDQNSWEYENIKEWKLHKTLDYFILLNNKNLDLVSKDLILKSLTNYNLSFSTNSLEQKYLSIWVGLEVLFSWNQDTFDMVKSFIPKVISMNYIWNSFDEFQDYLKMRKENENSHIKVYSNIIDSISSSNKVKNKEGEYIWKFNSLWIINYFTQKPLELEKIHNSFYYVKYKNLINLITNNTDIKLSDFLNKYEDRTRYSINRMYQLRNYIMHQWWYITDENLVWDLESLYLNLMWDILNKMSDERLLIYSLEEYMDKITRSHETYKKNIDDYLNKNIKNLCFPYIEI